MLILLGVVFVATTALFCWIYRASKHGELPLNAATGLRTVETMASTAVWQYVHKKYANGFLFSALLCVALCATVIAGGASSGNVNDMSTKYWWILSGIGAALCFVVVGVGVSAHFSARRFNQSTGEEH
ncbi:MAG: SdpI family protein [Ancrocorticia sp.]